MITNDRPKKLVFRKKWSKRYSPLSIHFFSFLSCVLWFFNRFFSKFFNEIMKMFSRKTDPNFAYQRHVVTPLSKLAICGIVVFVLVQKKHHNLSANHPKTEEIYKFRDANHPKMQEKPTICLQTTHTTHAKMSLWLTNFLGNFQPQCAPWKINLEQNYVKN